ncbi:MAG TPA: protein kinase [Myxococcales bacterium]|jgi:WD40 repeat protein/serine/threonine protein kinase
MSAPRPDDVSGGTAPATEDLADLGATLRPSLPPGVATNLDAEAVTPELPGRYSIRGELGRGGMGRVMVAFDEHIGREIAIKEVLNPEDKVATTVFLNEARVTGQLEHPFIVPVHEVGRAASGTLYYTMRLMRGQTLEAALQKCAGLKDRLQHLGTFWDLCKAISFVHSRGVLHRDLKPSNVMVGEYGETIVLDWGLAKLKPAPGRPGGSIASVGSTPEPAGIAVGTPAYMSPEQATGQNTLVDELSDVWGLGSVLYEVLTGQPPFEGSTVSKTLDMVATGHLVPVRTRCPEAPAELAAIAEKALSHARSARYQSAKELTGEIQAYMTGGRVRAHAYSTWELIKRAAAQNKPATAAAALALLAVVASLVVVSISRATERRAHLESEHHLAQAYQERAAKLFQENDLEHARAFTARSLKHNPTHPLGSSYDAEFAAASPEAVELRVEAASMLLQTQLRSVARPERTFGAPDGLWGVALSRDGRLLASGATAAGEVYVWERASGRLLQKLPTSKDIFTPIALSPDGSLLATGGRGRAVVLWNPTTGARVRELEGPATGTMSLAFSADGSRLAAGYFANAARVWEVAGGGTVATLEGHADTVESVAFSPDGALLATASRDNAVRLFGLPGGEPIATFQSASGPVLAVAFSPDGRTLATAGEERVVRFLSVPDGRPLRLLTGHRDAVTGLAFSPDGSLFASLGLDGTRLWDSTGSTLSVLEGASPDRGVAISADGSTLALGGDAHSVRLYQLKSDAGHAVLVGHRGSVNDVVFTPDGRQVLTASSDRTVRIWDTATQRPKQTLMGFMSAAFRLAVSPDGRTLATVAKDRTLRGWDLASGENRWTLGIGDNGMAVAFSADGKRIATGGVDKLVKIRDASSGEELASLEGHGGAVVRVAYSSDGKYLASASKDGTVRLWEAATGRPVRTLAAHTDWAWGLAFSPDGRTLASSSKDGQFAVWDVETGALRRKLAGHGAWVNDVKFSADGKLLATCGDDWTARLWDARTLEPLLVLRADSAVDALALSADGRTLALTHGNVAELYSVDVSKVLEVDPAAFLPSEPAAASR